MQLDNLLYALVQVIHNFGAAAAVGLPIAVVRLRPSPDFVQKLIWVGLAAWLAQTVSGVGFGAVSYFMLGELPEIHNLAFAALVVKILCAALAIGLFVALLLRPAARAANGVWFALSGCGSAALLSAAFLRWFS